MKRRSQGEGRSQKERGGAKNWWRWIGGAGGAAAFTVHLEMFNSIHFRLISLDLIGFLCISLYFTVFRIERFVSVSMAHRVSSHL